MRPPSKIDPAELEKKRARILKKIGNTNYDNPHLAEYRSKLVELQASKTKSHDEFINWVSGLTTASMYFALTAIKTATVAPRILLLLSATLSFLALLAALAFKLFLEVRYKDLELEVHILKTLFTAHEAQTNITLRLNAGEQISDDQQQVFLQNMDAQLDLLDPDTLPAFKAPVERQAARMLKAYWTCIGLFLAGLALLISSHIVAAICT